MAIEYPIMTDGNEQSDYDEDILRFHANEIQSPQIILSNRMRNDRLQKNYVKNVSPTKKQNLYGANRSMDNRKLSQASRNYDIPTLDSKSIETVNSIGTNISNPKIDYDSMEIKLTSDESVLANTLPLNQVLAQDQHVKSKITAARVISIYGDLGPKNRKLKDTLKNVINKQSQQFDQLQLKRQLDQPQLQYLSVDFSKKPILNTDYSIEFIDHYQQNLNYKANYQLNDQNIILNSFDKRTQKTVQQERISRKSVTQTRQIYRGNEPPIPPSIQVNKVRGDKVKNGMQILIQKTQSHNTSNEKPNYNGAGSFQNSSPRALSIVHELQDSTNNNYLNHIENKFLKHKSTPVRTSINTKRKLEHNQSESGYEDKIKLKQNLQQQDTKKLLVMSQREIQVNRSLEQKNIQHQQMQQLQQKFVHNNNLNQSINLNHYANMSPDSFQKIDKFSKDYVEAPITQYKTGVDDNRSNLVVKRKIKLSNLSSSVNHIQSMRNEIIMRQQYVPPINNSEVQSRVDRDQKFMELMNRDWQNQFDKLSDNLKIVRSKEKKVRQMISKESYQDLDRKKVEKSVTFILPEIMN
ncbi:UNKNOWN [Stylonychia lemnae]|uniref:Uncharacterized protein n=1 Tax=Stylonychia lemnae TaxID=5949 RepID=A0A078A854_STYLE|nr:UNKNOWN [Stylonychia lemnae]|eukprot:CDW78399.1 UNKNOWN [Stylonychia lemnae]